MRPENFEDMALLQVFKDHGVKIYTRDMVYDLSTPTGQLMAQVKMGMSAFERATIRQRTYGKRLQLRSEGLCAAGENSLPLGVTRVQAGQHWAYDWDDDIEKVRRLFDLFVSGVANFRTLARKTGISYYSIRDLLSNTAYIGIRVYDTVRDPKGNVYDPATGKLRYQKKMRRPEEEVERVQMLGRDGKRYNQQSPSSCSTRPSTSSP